MRVREIQEALIALALREQEHHREGEKIRAEIIRLHDEGVRDGVIAEHLGVTKQAVQRRRTRRCQSRQSSWISMES